MRTRRRLSLTDILNNVVTKRILDQREGVCCDPLYKKRPLHGRSMINAALDDTTSMAVRANNNTVLTNGVDDELSILGLQMIETFLDHVVAVEILDQLHYTAAQCSNDGLNLKVSDMFEESNGMEFT